MVTLCSGVRHLWIDQWRRHKPIDSGNDTDPATFQPVYGPDKGLGVGDVLQFSSADLYYGSTQLSSASGNVTIEEKAQITVSLALTKKVTCVSLMLNILVVSR